jgi:hypothetical protein
MTGLCLCNAKCHSVLPTIHKGFGESKPKLPSQVVHMRPSELAIKFMTSGT